MKEVMKKGLGKVKVNDWKTADRERKKKKPVFLKLMIII